MTATSEGLAADDPVLELDSVELDFDGVERNGDGNPVPDDWDGGLPFAAMAGHPPPPSGQVPATPPPPPVTYTPPPPPPPTADDIAYATEVGVQRAIGGAVDGAVGNIAYVTLVAGGWILFCIFVAAIVLTIVDEFM